MYIIPGLFTILAIKNMSSVSPFCRCGDEAQKAVVSLSLVLLCED